DAIAAYADLAAWRSNVDGAWYRDFKEIRSLAARLINARGPHEIAFIPNTSTGIAQVANGLDLNSGDNVIITNVEYPANRYPWENLTKRGIELREVAQQPDGRIDVHDVVEAINDNTRVVSLSLVQYATGFCIDLKPISEMVHQAGGYLCVDAIQAVGAMPVDVQMLGIDFLAADSHKWMLGPEGAGIFYCHEDLVHLLEPLVVGWMCMVDAANYGDYRFELLPNARRFEPGTWNAPGILGMGASMKLLLDIGLDKVWSRIETLTARLCEGLQAKGYRTISPREDGERSGIVCFLPPNDNLDCGQIVKDLEARSIFITVREGRLRASPHFYNIAKQIDRLIEALP
ncbi:MAG: aminotransferase class V-fold PLP-dependent enzyme, partial [Rhodospirillales bacterium]|nr:aminotransferase class V-fold PLP-dependent enzyme [Rhodospirillales bacterium]